MFPPCLGSPTAFSLPRLSRFEPNQLKRSNFACEPSAAAAILKRPGQCLYRRNPNRTMAEAPATSRGARLRVSHWCNRRSGMRDACDPAIRRAYPDAHLTLLTTPGTYRRSRHAEDLLGEADWIDEILIYDLDEIAKYKGRLALGRKLRARKFDVWFDLVLIVRDCPGCFAT